MNYEFDWKKYSEAARRTVAEGCVLLKNDKEALPIKKGEKVSVFGRIQLDYYKSGTGSGGMVNAPYVVSILDGLKACQEIRINEELLDVYRNWAKENPFDMGEGWAKEPWCQKEMPVDAKLAQKAASDSDIALVILGRSAGEDKDNSPERGSYLLTTEEESLLQTVCSAFSRTVVVLNVGSIIDMKWVDTINPQAVLYVWQGGAEGGSGAADVLTGRVNPSGKLSDTIAKDIDDYPSTAYFGDEKENIYAEDIYVGYRYFETFAKEKVRFPFGFGLSYTHFETEISDFKYSGLQATFCVKVKNTGERSGKEVVQVYACPPQGRLGKPLRSLAVFEKTMELSPGEEQTLQFAINVKDLASYDDSGKTGHKSCYVLEPGEYTIFVGTDVRNALPAGSFCLEELIVTQKLEEAMAPVKAFKRLVPAMADGDSMVMDMEEAPVREIDLQARILERKPSFGSCAKDQGWKLTDVMSEKVSMEDFLSQLTDEELICLTRGEGMCSPKVTAGIASAFGGLTPSLQEYGIPAAGCADGPSGIRMDCGTKAFSLPNGTLTACTFNTKLVKELYDMLGLELRKNKIDTLLGPGLNIHRNPLGGRNFEYFSEDPYLTGTMASAQLQALHPYKVTGTIKHFACNNQEKNRNDVNAVVSERALREIYLKGFEMAVKEGGAYSVMSTYGPVNGIWTAGNYDLLTTILRREWGFKGIVMTDWWAKMNEEGQEASMRNTVPMVRAQNDLYMVVADTAANSAKDHTDEGLKTGRITRGELIRSAGNICGFLLKSQLLEQKIYGEDAWSVLNEIASKEGEICSREGGIVAGTLVLNTQGVDTTKGSQVQYALFIREKGTYELTMKMNSHAKEMAQMPVSVFANNHHIGTVSINGTAGQTVTKTLRYTVTNAIDNYLKFYFGESGIILEEIKIEYVPG